MGATSITGVGPGDSHKRIAYLSRDLPKLEVTETTSNPQDLITTEVSGGGDFGTQWELMYSRAVPVSDPNDGSPVPSGVLFDPLYEWAFGIHAIVYPMVFALVPITTPLLLSVMNLNTTLDYVGMQWSPDNGTTVFNFLSELNEIAFLAVGALLPQSTVVLNEAGSGPNRITVDGTTGEFYTDYQDAVTADIYFVIARRRIVAL